ncbi:MAG: HAMP domain-containing sensor histidine kinase [bacterium]|nr:HAMP domain-containing sensor histidine kinase [bacterium]
MGLANFISDNTLAIIEEWESFARELTPAANDMTPLALRNHISDILQFIMSDMASPQTGSEQIEKSHGHGVQLHERKPSAAEIHAALRLAGGFNLNQMVSEYRALRASVIKLWKISIPGNSSLDLDDLVRFNEAVDQALSESISYYKEKLNDSRNLFLGILTHDMRNPLGAMLMSAELIARIGNLNSRQEVLVAQIIESGGRVSEIVSHLLDITRARFGTGVAIIQGEMDIGYIGRLIVDEMWIKNPETRFLIEVSGDTTGYWDKSRIGQVFSNLLGNAVQYGFKGAPIAVNIVGAAEGVSVTVHNQGVPINPAKIGMIFDSLARVNDDAREGKNVETGNLGLGLFITKEVITAHKGTITVSSTEKGGTTFTAHFPRSKKTAEM